MSQNDSQREIKEIKRYSLQTNLNINEIKKEMDFMNKENNINSNNNLNNNNSFDINSINNSFSCSKLLSQHSHVDFQISPSQFSFKPRSSLSFAPSSNNNPSNINNSIEKENFNTPQKPDNGNTYERMLTVEKLRVALAPQPFLNINNNEIYHSKTDAKHFPKYPEFKKVTFDDLPDLELMILDDIDKKAFNTFEKMNFPTIEEIAEIMKNKDIKEEDFDYYSSVSYLLFVKRKEFSSKERQLILNNIPFNIINDLFINNQSYSLINDSSSSALVGGSQSGQDSFLFPAKNINTLCMVINIIIFCIQSESDMTIFIENYGKDEVLVFIDNMCFLLQNSDNFRLQRKILGLITNFFQYNDEIILYFFRKLERIIDNCNMSSNIIIKLQQVMKNIQKKYINSILENKNEIEEQIRNNDIETLCYRIKFLVFILSGTQATYIYDCNEYIPLLRYFKGLKIKNEKIEEYIIQLKIRIRRVA